MKIISNLPNPTAPTGPRPDGALKDVSAPAAGDGTPSRADWHNDHYYALLAIMDNVGISADDSDEEVESGGGVSQFLDAMRLFVQENGYPGLDFGLKDISGGNQASDITIYEAGGGSEKEDGFTVRLRWTGGDGTFAHTITAANTVGNELTGFIAANLWIGNGAGELVLRLDKTNSKWLVLTPGIWDIGSNSNGEWKKTSEGDLEMTHTDGTATSSTATGQIFRSTSPITWTYPISVLSIQNRTISGDSNQVWGGFDTVGLTTLQYRMLSATSRTGIIPILSVKGKWA